MNAEAADALGSEPDLFQMGGTLVGVAARPERDADGGRVRRPAGTPAVRPVPPPLLAERLTRSARFVEQKMRCGHLTREPCHPPVHCVRAVHDRGDWPAVRRLDALLPYPAFLADGRVLTAPGYDPATGLYLADAPPLAVPDRPTPAQARAAAAELLDLLAALLTPLAWFAFDGSAPLFVTDGNAPAAGKGKLLHVLTGRPFPVSNYNNDPTETKKVITTLAVEADTLVLFEHPKLIEHVRANRPRLLAAALTILRGWHVAGRLSVELPEWGTFERWGRWCGRR